MRSPLLLACVLSLLTAAAIAGCGGDGDPGVPVTMGVPDVPAGEEPPPAGFQFHSTTYTVPGTGDERTIRLHLWYATADEAGTSTRFNAISVDANSWTDATVRVPRGQAPVMIYSHGDRSWGGSNYRLARQFVRNGWIVISMDHTGNTALDNIVPRPFEFDVVRAYDVQATLDFIADLPAEHPLAGHVDTSRVLVAGHSYGGQTAWLVGGTELDMDAIEARCELDVTCGQDELDAYAMYEPDSRVVGVVPLDGGIGDQLVADSGFAAMIAPVMFLTVDDDPGDMDLFERSTGVDVTWVTLAGACHESFTGTFPCDGLPLETSLPITATYAIAFGTRHVLQSEDPALLDLLDGTTEVNAVATLSHHGE